MADDGDQINSGISRDAPIIQRHEEEKRQEDNPTDTSTSQRQRQNNLYLTKADHEADVIFQAAQLSPVLDRVGRMMADLAPQLNNIVRQHKIKVQEEQRARQNAQGAQGSSASS